ncbi:MAG: hypothetical protein IH924_09815, partial [Proteobacteria bacterium]|nr:hypothetical protein [Pseudomonadota bacterium]
MPGGGAAFIAEATVEGLGAGGDGIATLADGRRAFLPYAAPGDLVRATFAPARGGELAGTVTEVLRQGEGRAQPVCPHFGTCGGCTLQHLEDGLYAAWKRETVIKALARHGLGDAPVEPLVRTPPASRRRARFTARRGAAAPRAPSPSGSTPVGLTVSSISASAPCWSPAS